VASKKSWLFGALALDSLSGVEDELLLDES
jgi:hypothetical protein